MNPKAKNGLYIRTLGNEKVVYDKTNGRAHFLNQTATFVFDLCDGTHSREEIIDGLLQAYEVARETAETDVDRILKHLEENLVILP